MIRVGKLCVIVLAASCGGDDMPPVNPDASLPACTSNEQCSAPTPVCDLDGTKTCVQCTEAQADACTGTTPVCGDDHACRGCQAHDECPSAACLPDGSCGSDSNVAYVDPAGTDNDNCTKATPCTKVEKALATNRPYVKFRGTTDEAVSLEGGRVVTFLAEPGAVLTRSSGTGPIISVQDDNTSLTVYDLSISNAPNNPSGRGILMQGIGSPSVTLVRVTVANNPGGGISASGGNLTVSQSTISANNGGGISVTGADAMFTITNNFIYRNGNNTTATFGGVDLGVSAPGQSRFEFNTVVDNQATSGPLNAGGVRCSSTTFSAPNNLIVRNRVNGDATATNANTNGGCTYPTSHIAATIAGLNFASPDEAPFDYHLMPGSVAIDKATTPTTVTTDFDGDTRPQGTAPDQGADEVR